MNCDEDALFLVCYWYIFWERESMNEVFVFGAGASYASGGTPLGKDLVWNYYADCSTMHAIGHNGRPSNADLEEKRKDFVDFGNFLLKIQDRYPGLSGINQKWNEAMENAEVFYPDIEKPYYIDEIMEDLVSAAQHSDEVRLIKRLAGNHIAESANIHANAYYKKFVKSLKGKTRDEISIISFNFDCLLRDDLEDRIHFDYLIDFENIDSRRCFYEPGHGIPLIKLHGSLDWRLEAQTGSISLLPWVWGESYGGEACIFLPHEHINKKILKLWDAAAQYIKSAEKITFIGYSMPTYDKDAMRLFQENIQQGAHIKVIDCAQATIDRYKASFPAYKIEGVVRDLSAR